MIEMLEQMVQGLADSEVFTPSIARLYRKMLVALKEEGFTEEQAMDIIKNLSFTSGS